MLNPYPYPLVPYPGLAPELAVRSAMGGWGPYAQPAPADRFLPFVVTRTLDLANSRWLNCARVEHADTGALITTLTPVGYTGAAGNDFDLPFRKYTDEAHGVEHFVYFGGIVQALALPCGVPLRLVVDTEWQSPRFHAVPDLSGFLLLEWWDNGPANGVPYGTGFRQRLYVENAALQFTEPTTEKETTKNAATGEERIDYLAKTNNAAFTVPLVPAYLAEAVSGAEASAHLEIDGQAWQAVDIKPAVQGEDGGRWNLAITVKQKQVLRYRASCPPDPLADAGYDATADAPRPYRCGDTSDTAPDFVDTGGFNCETDDFGNTGYAVLETRDNNPYSTTCGQTSQRNVGQDARCPVPPTYYSAKVSGYTTRNNCPTGQTGESVYFEVLTGAFTSRANQQAANDLAQAAYDANRQANANTTGSCAGGADTGYGPVYNGDGCFACQMENRGDATDIRSATLAESRQYFRRTDNNGDPCTPC